MRHFSSISGASKIEWLWLMSSSNLSWLVKKWCRSCLWRHQLQERPKIDPPVNLLAYIILWQVSGEGWAENAAVSGKPNWRALEWLRWTRLQQSHARSTSYKQTVQRWLRRAWFRWSKRENSASWPYLRSYSKSSQTCSSPPSQPPRGPSTSAPPS